VRCETNTLIFFCLLKVDVVAGAINRQPLRRRERRKKKAACNPGSGSPPLPPLRPRLPPPRVSHLASRWRRHCRLRYHSPPAPRCASPGPPPLRRPPRLVRLDSTPYLMPRYQHSDVPSIGLSTLWLCRSALPCIAHLGDLFFSRTVMFDAFQQPIQLAVCVTAF
jgi:hypothetical protein